MTEQQMSPEVVVMDALIAQLESAAARDMPVQSVLLQARMFRETWVEQHAPRAYLEYRTVRLSAKSYKVTYRATFHSSSGDRAYVKDASGVVCVVASNIGSIESALREHLGDQKQLDEVLAVELVASDVAVSS